MTVFRSAADVEKQAADREVGRLLEAAIEALPDPFRAVFVLRDVEVPVVTRFAAISTSHPMAT